jgi:hypothetical protein
MRCGSPNMPGPGSQPMSETALAVVSPSPSDRPFSPRMASRPATSASCAATSIPDVSVSDMEDPERAALVLAFRAEVAREVRTAQFSDLRGLVGGLSTGIAAGLASPGQRAAGERAAGPVVRLAPRLALLAGREELLAGLDARLAGNAGAGPRVVALHGLGGAGKTSVAVEYAYRHLGEVGVAWQLAAEDATVLAAGFTGLAAQLGAREAAGGGDPVAAVHSALAAPRGLAADLR